MTDVDQIKSNIDIVDLVKEYVQLKAAGTNHKGLCPFHNEKSPSFMVNHERQSFKCFGCGKGGDIFTFVQEIEGMEFVEALKLLADKAGVTLSKQVGQSNSSQKNRIKDINSEAARFYHKFLLQIESAKPAREYIKGRGLTKETVEAWQIGYVPEQWDLLTKYLLKKGHSIDDLVASGLTIKRDGANAGSGRGFYDRFRGRVMFPIRDVHGSVVGFTGRVLVETEKSGGKYVNTPQTIVYDKSRVVFGLNKAKQVIKKQDLIVMVEGQMDVIACHQAGFENVVASSGTALTEFQVKLLKRYSGNMNMAFDADDAGQAAAKRGIDIALAEGMHVKVIHIPEGKGKDPDDCVQQYPDVWKDAVANAKEVMLWYVEKAFAGKDMSSPRAKQEVVDEVVPEINRIPYAVEKDHWVRELAGRIGVDPTVILEDMARLGKKKLEIRNQKSAEMTPRSVQKEQDRLERLVSQFLALLLRFPSFVHWQLVVDERPFASSPYKALYEAIKMMYTGGTFDLDALRPQVAPEAGENPVDVLLMQAEWEFSAITDTTVLQTMTELYGQVVGEWKKRKRSALQNEIARAEQAGDGEKVQALLAEFQQI